MALLTILIEAGIFLAVIDVIVSIFEVVVYFIEFFLGLAKELVVSTIYIVKILFKNRNVFHDLICLFLASLYLLVLALVSSGPHFNTDCVSQNQLKAEYWHFDISQETRTKLVVSKKKQSLRQINIWNIHRN